MEGTCIQCSHETKFSRRCSVQFRCAFTKQVLFTQVREGAMRVLPVLYTALFELDLCAFLAAGIGTGLLNIVLSADQTKRIYYVADGSVWVSSA